VLATLHSIFGSIKEKVNGVKAKNSPNKEARRDLGAISTKLEVPSVSAVSYVRIVNSSTEYCPHCSYLGGEEKTVNIYVSIEGPIYLSKEISSKNFRPMVKLTKILKCSKCGFIKYRKTMYMPLETIDIIEDFLPEDLRKTIDNIKTTTVTVEKILKTFIG